MACVGMEGLHTRYQPVGASEEGILSCEVRTKRTLGAMIDIDIDIV